MLTIAKVSRKDAGLYECAAANALGTAISSCTLAVARKCAAGGTSRDRGAAPQGESTRRARTPGLGTAWSRLLGLCPPHLQETEPFEGGRIGFAQAPPASPSPRVVLPWPCSSSALPLAGHPAHLLCPSQGSLGGRAPRRSPRSTRTQCWCCGSRRRAKPPAPTRWSAGWTVRGAACPPQGAAAGKMGSPGDTKPRQKCPMSSLSPGARQDPESGVGRGGCPRLTLPPHRQGSTSGRSSAPASPTATST